HCRTRKWVAPYKFFFFQAEDGIRDKLVTGVQTCALPILPSGARPAFSPGRRRACPPGMSSWCRDRSRCSRNSGLALPRSRAGDRSEERRVGKECISWGAVVQLKKYVEREAFWQGRHEMYV